MMRAIVFAGMELLLVAGAHAQEALYGKQPPKGSAFVRMVNATPSTATVTADFQEQMQLGTSTAARVGMYTVVGQAAGRTLNFSVSEGGHEGRFAYKVAAEGYVTILMEQDGAGAVTFTPVVDHADFNQTRARLAFYNAAQGCALASLRLDPSGPLVFQDVPAGATKSRTVNPVQATVRASCDGQKESSLALSGMELGASYSLWLIRPEQQVVLFIAPDKTAKFKG